MCSLGIEPTTFALLTQCSTTEPREHIIIIIILFYIKRYNTNIFLTFKLYISKLLFENIIAWTFKHV